MKPEYETALQKCAKKLVQERETVCVHSPNDRLWRVSSDDPRRIKKLLKHHTPSEVREGGTFEFILEDKLVAMRAPRKITEEQRKATSERIKAMHAQRKGGTEVNGNGHSKTKTTSAPEVADLALADDLDLGGDDLELA